MTVGRINIVKRFTYLSIHFHFNQCCFNQCLLQIKTKLLQTTKRNKTKKEMLYECRSLFVKSIAKVSEKTPKNKSSSSVQGPSKQPYKKQALS